MKKIKKIDTNKRKKERKEVQERMQRTVGAMLNLPEECGMCKTFFDKKSKEMAQTWHVMVYEQKNKIYLTCPPCWDKVKVIAEGNRDE